MPETAVPETRVSTVRDRRCWAPECTPVQRGVYLISTTERNEPVYALRSTTDTCTANDPGWYEATWLRVTAVLLAGLVCSVGAGAEVDEEIDAVRSDEGARDEVRDLGERTSPGGERAEAGVGTGDLERAAPRDVELACERGRKVRAGKGDGCVGGEGRRPGASNAVARPEESPTTKESKPI